jgi:hypothetical protein
MPAPQHKRASAPPAPDASPLTQLPDDLLAASIVQVLEPKELLALQQCDKRLQRLAVSERGASSAQGGVSVELTRCRRVATGEPNSIARDDAWVGG